MFAKRAINNDECSKHIKMLIFLIKTKCSQFYITNVFINFYILCNIKFFELFSQRLSDLYFVVEYLCNLIIWNCFNVYTNILCKLSHVKLSNLKCFHETLAAYQLSSSLTITIWCNTFQIKFLLRLTH